MKKAERLEAKKELESLYAEFKDKFPDSEFEGLADLNRIVFHFRNLNGVGIMFDLGKDTNKKDYVLISFYASQKEFKGYSSSYFGKDSVNQYHFKKATKFCYPECLIEELRKYFEAIYTGEALRTVPCP